MFSPGRSAALARLAAIRPERYARTRNFLTGDVTRLSPYLRHGMLDLAEVRDAVLARGLPQRDIWKFIFELGWRDYWRRAYGVLGDGVWDDVESAKSGAAEYADALPDDITSGTTGLVCIDGFAADLLKTGYVHNHARMWVAAYIVHHRRIRWQAGARWYLGHLLDGDPSSNNLSWQWVAGTFSADPYIFNRENLERYTAGRYCRVCPLASGGCPFDADYATLRTRLLEKQPLPVEKRRVDLTIDADADAGQPHAEMNDAVVWVHPDAMSDQSIAHRTAPNSSIIAAGFDAMHVRDGWSEQRRAFVDASLATMRVDAQATGSDAGAIVEFARAKGARRVVTTATPDPLLRGIAADIARRFPLTVLDPPRFVTISRRLNVKRFSAYWKHVQDAAFRLTDRRLD